MKTVKIIGSYYGGFLTHSKKFNVPTILAKSVKGVLELLGYYVI